MAEWKFGTMVSRDLAMGPILVMVVGSPRENTEVIVQEASFTVADSEWIGFPLTDNGQTHESFYPKFATCWLEADLGPDEPINTEIEPTIP